MLVISLRREVETFSIYLIRFCGSFRSQNFKFNFTQKWLFHLWFSLHRVANKCLELTLIGAQGWPAPYNLPWGPWTPGPAAPVGEWEWHLGVSSFTFTKSEFTGIYKGLQEFTGMNFTGVFFHFHKKWIYRGFQEFTGMNFTGVFFHFHKKWIYRNL